MTHYIDHSRKVNRAIRLAEIGTNPQSADEMLHAIPAQVIEALPARLIAQLLDANWRLAQASKALAATEAIENGIIWDSRQQRSHEIIS